MLLRLFLIFTIIPLAELVLLRGLSDVAGLPVTILIVLATGFLGAWLARQQGFQAWRRIHMQMVQGKTPGVEIVDGVMILLAGAVLITPGLMTDFVGFALLIPPIRKVVRARAMKWFKTQTVARFETNIQGFPQEPRRNDDSVIDAEFTRVEPQTTSDDRESSHE